MKDGHVPSEHKFEIALKKQVSTDENDTIHFCHTFECSTQNREQLFFVYFEMKILKPKLHYLSPKKIGSQVNQMDTSNAGPSGNNNPSRNNHSNTTNNISSSNNNSSSSSFSQPVNFQNNCSTNSVKPDAKRLEIENKHLKKKLSSFKQEKNDLIKDIEKESNDWMMKQQELFNHREKEMLQSMNEQIRAQEAKATKKLKDDMNIYHNTLKKQMKDQSEKQLIDQKMAYEDALEQMKNDRETAEKQLIIEKQRAHELGNANYEINNRLSSLENDMKQNIKEGETVLALTSLGKVSSETFFDVNNKDLSRKKRKPNNSINETNESIGASPASAIIEED